MTEIITVKPLMPDQWQLHKTIRCAALADAPYAFSTTLESALERDWVEFTHQRATDPNSITFFAFAGDTPCGMAACAVEDDEAEMFAVWVAPSHRRSRAGLALVQFAAQWASSRGAKRLNVGVYNDNAGALAFYRSADFKETAKIKPEFSTEKRYVLLLAMALGNDE
jgi:ribosomal protein S18 acetylase RimI-like enzyme